MNKLIRAVRRAAIFVLDATDKYVIPQAAMDTLVHARIDHLPAALEYVERKAALWGPSDPQVMRGLVAINTAAANGLAGLLAQGLGDAPPADAPLH